MPIPKFFACPRLPMRVCDVYELHQGEIREKPQQCQTCRRDYNLLAILWQNGSFKGHHDLFCSTCDQFIPHKPTRGVRKPLVNLPLSQAHQP